MDIAAQLVDGLSNQRWVCISSRQPRQWLNCTLQSCCFIYVDLFSHCLQTLIGFQLSTFSWWIFVYHQTKTTIINLDAQRGCVFFFPCPIRAKTMHIFVHGQIWGAIWNFTGCNCFFLFKGPRSGVDQLSIYGQDICVLMMTSGTTGRPKTIAGSHPAADEKHALVTNGFWAKTKKPCLEVEQHIGWLATVYILVGFYYPKLNLSVIVL